MTSILYEVVFLILRHLWLYLLLRLPVLYFLRVARVFEEAELTRAQLASLRYSFNSDLNHDARPPLETFSRRWNDLLVSLKAEWQAQGIVSALLLPSVLTMLQIGKIESDPISSTFALASLICALMNLMYGTTLYIQFNYINPLNVAVLWAEEAQRTKTRMLWNLWVFLSMPAVWLCWAIIFFMASLLSYVWRAHLTGVDTFAPLPTRQALGPRIAISAIFALGLLCLALVIRTLAATPRTRRELPIVTGHVGEQEAREEESIGV